MNFGAGGLNAVLPSTSPRNRARRDDYTAAIEEMFARTDTEWAPWTLVEGDSKRWARVKVLDATIAAIEDGMRRRGLEPAEEIET